MPSATWARPSVLRAPVSLAGFCSLQWALVPARPQSGRGAPHPKSALKGGAAGRPQRGAMLGRGLLPARGQGAAVAGPGRPHPGASGAWLSLQGPRKQNQSTEVGPTGKFGPMGRAVQKTARRLRRGWPCTEGADRPGCEARTGLGHSRGWGVCRMQRAQRLRRVASARASGPLWQPWRPWGRREARADGPGDGFQRDSRQS